MGAEFSSFAVILGMGITTALTRVGGFALMRWVPLTPRVQAFLRSVPVAVIGAFLAPILVQSGPLELFAVAAAFGITLVLRNDLLAVAAAVTIAALARNWPF